ncbi:MAG: hypothetical protein H6737_26430 [Alphaproteobacteria bacterium]|nr:hypothetical protein [Alphaproteobacteria bacterium]
MSFESAFREFVGEVLDEGLPDPARILVLAGAFEDDEARVRALGNRLHFNSMSLPGDRLGGAVAGAVIARTMEWTALRRMGLWRVPNDAVIDHLWAWLERSLQSSSRQLFAKIIVAGVRTTRAVEITPGVSFGLISDAELRAIQQLMGVREALLAAQSCAVLCATRFEEGSANPGMPRPDIRAAVAEVQLAADILRTVEGFRVRDLLHFVDSDDFLDPSWRGVRSTHGMQIPMSAPLADPVVLLEHCRQYTNIPEQVELGLRRYRFACHRTEPIDALLDCGIAMEAVLTSAKGTDVTFRFAIFGSAICGLAGEDPDIVYKELKDFYNVRSTLAHGKGGTASSKLKFGSQKGDQHHVRPLVLERTRRVLNAAARTLPRADDREALKDLNDFFAKLVLAPFKPGPEE